MKTTPSLRRRAVRAYWTTLIVVLSYTALRVRNIFSSEVGRRTALRRCHVANARRIEQTIRQLHGLYIKVGQLFSVMANFLPPEFRQELEGLQDAVPPREYSVIRARIVDELGAPPEELFSSFANAPIASASLGQVHHATLHDGREVAVKVQYPDVEAMVKADLRTLRAIVGFVERFVLPGHSLMTVYHEIQQMITAELDFCEEARNLERIAKNFRDDPTVTLPGVIWEHSSSRVLTIDFVHGIKLTHAHEQPGSLSHKEIGARLLHAYCKQIFEHGVYHADPHPGNLLLTQDNRIALLDFGAVAELSESMRQGIVDLLQGVLSANTESIQQALRDMGFIKRHGGDEAVEQVLMVLHERLHASLRIDSMNLSDIQVDPAVVFDVLADLRRLNVTTRDIGTLFHVPSQWILLERTVLLLTGLCTELDDELRPMDFIRPYIERMLFSRNRDWSSLAFKTGKEVGLTALSLPADIKKVMRRATLGRLEFRSPDIRESSQQIVAVGHQLIWTLLAVTCGTLSAVFEQGGNPQRAEWLAMGCAGFGLLLFVSMWRNRRRSR